MRTTSRASAVPFLISLLRVFMAWMTASHLSKCMTIPTVNSSSGSASTYIG